MWKSKHYSCVEKTSVKFGTLLGDGFKKAGLSLLTLLMAVSSAGVELRRTSNSSYLMLVLFSGGHRNGAAVEKRAGLLWALVPAAEQCAP